MTGKLYYWVADWNLTRAEAARRLSNDVWNMVDCIHDDLPKCKATTAEVMAGYVTGSPDIRWDQSDWNAARFVGMEDRLVMRIDQSNSDLPLHADTTLVKDIEPGASTDSVAVKVAKQRLDSGRDYMLYIEASALGWLEHLVSLAGLPHGEIVAYQYASPSSAPHLLLPGTRQTIKEVNADLSVIRRNAYPLPREVHAEPSPAHDHSLARASINGTTVELDLKTLEWSAPHDKHASIVPLPWGD